ncbi:MAG: hypothetical protein WD273_05535 [Trueperaceae bacterium]
MPKAQNETIQVDFVPHDVLTLPGRLGVIHGVHADSDEDLTPEEV